MVGLIAQTFAVPFSSRKSDDNGGEHGYNGETKGWVPSQCLDEMAVSHLLVCSSSLCPEIVQQGSDQLCNACEPPGGAMLDMFMICYSEALASLLVKGPFLNARSWTWLA
eukprot:1143124-Pelagomonas_calceolata.AAC.3